MTAADPPISVGERSFLRSVRQHAHKTFFVMNKVDALSPDEAEQVARFTRDVITEAIGHDVDVAAVSARRAMRDGDAGLEAFKQTFSRFLDRDIPRVIVGSIAQKARDVVAQIRAGVAVELDALSLSVVEIASRRHEVVEVRRETERVRSDLRVLIQREVDVATATIEEELAEWRRRQGARLLDEVETRLEETDTVAPEQLDQHIKDLLRSDIEAWRPQLETNVGDAWSAIARRFVGQAEEAANRAVLACSRILDLDLPPAPAIDPLGQRSRFTFAFFEVPSVLESLLPDLPSVLPERWASRIVGRRMREKIPLLVDKHSGRLRYDLVTRLRSSSDELVRELDRHLACTTEGLEAALDRAMGSVDSMEGSRSRSTPGLLRLDAELLQLANQLWEAVEDASKDHR